jgi:aminoglycoside phosphotransferase (APT) family kinase protein
MYCMPAHPPAPTPKWQHGCVELVGRGRTADVFAFGNGRVVKVFHADVPRVTIDREASVARALSAVQLSVPRFEGVIQVDGRDGLVFERVTGPSMLSVLAQAPWRVVPLAQLLANVHWRIHAERATGLPRQRDYVSNAIRAAALPEARKIAALSCLAELPDNDRVCHGDFHPDNVVLTSRGPVVIDWLTAVRGEPAGDVARTLLLLRYASPPSGPGLILVLVLRRLFAAAYWRHYARRTGMRQSAADAWRVPLIAARLAENLPADERLRLLRLLS